MVSVYWHNQQIHDSVTSMQQELGWQTIQDRRNDPKLIIFFKIIQGLVAVPLPSYIERPTRFTRHMHLLSYRQIHTTANYYKFSFFPSAIVMWNNLPATTVFHPDLEGFRQSLPSPSAPWTPGNMFLSVFNLKSLHFTHTFIFLTFSLLTLLSCTDCAPVNNTRKGSLDSIDR